MIDCDGPFNKVGLDRARINKWHAENIVVPFFMFTFCRQIKIEKRGWYISWRLLKAKENNVDLILGGTHKRTTVVVRVY